MKLIPGQGISFFEWKDFNQVNLECKQDWRKWCQQVLENQFSYHQFDASADGDEVLSDRLFEGTCGIEWICLFGASIGAGAEFASDGAVLQNVNIVQGFYRVVVKVSGMAANSGNKLLITLEQATIQHTIDAGNLPDGEHTIWILNPFSGLATFIITGLAASTWVVEEVSLKRATSPVAKLRDCDGNLMEYVPEISFREGVYPEGKMELAVLWSLDNMPHGCYRVCLVDEQIEEVELGEFDCVDIFAGGCSGDVNELILDQASALWEVNFRKPCYLLTFEITDADETQVSEFLWSVAVNSSSIFTSSDLAGAKKKYAFRFEVPEGLGNIIFSLSEYSQITFENIKLYAVNCEEICSECFDFFDCEDLVKISYRNENNFLRSNGQFIEWDSNSPNINLYLKGGIRQKTYPYKEKQIYKNSLGEIVLQYADSEKIQELIIEDAPPYFYDWLRLVFVHHEVYIKDERYIILDDAIVPQIEDDSLLAPATVEIMPANQRDINSLCGVDVEPQEIVCPECDSLAVDFSVNNSTPNGYQTITFTDLTPGSTEWLWDFGDGNLSTLQNPTHKYRKEGFFTVTLWASDGTKEGFTPKTNFVTVSVPPLPTTGLLARYDADDFIINSGAVSQWNDSSGNNFHLVQGTPANRPTVLTNEINGHDAASWDGINDSLIGAHASMSMATPICVAILMRANQPYSGNQIYFSEQSTGSAHKRLWKPANTRGYQYRDSASGNLEYITGMPNNIWTLHIINFNAGSSNYQCYDYTETGAASLTTMASGTGFVLGNTVIGGVLMDVAEVVVYDGAKNQAFKDEIAEYFMTKFDLSKFGK